MSREKLEAIIDSEGLTGTLELIEEICTDRAETGDDDDSNADMWDEAREVIEEAIDTLPEGV